jgi:hypothetical protein
MKQGMIVKGENTLWYKDDILHREDGPALFSKKRGVIYYEAWFKEGKLHREDGPARVWKDGRSYWYKEGKLHREDGPAFFSYSKEKRWYINGKLHRLDGPAVIDAYGEEWWVDGKLHRTDGPAIDSTHQKVWAYQGKYHNKYGPAVIKKIGSEEVQYFLNGKSLSYEEWWDKINESAKIQILFNPSGFQDSLVWKKIDLEFLKK